MGDQSHRNALGLRRGPEWQQAIVATQCQYVHLARLQKPEAVGDQRARRWYVARTSRWHEDRVEAFSECRGRLVHVVPGTVGARHDDWSKSSRTRQNLAQPRHGI